MDEPDRSAEEVSGTELTLLLVEDDPRIRRALGLAMRDQGFAVLEASDGETALALLDPVHAHDHSIDLVVLDVMLPTIDGIEVCRRIRESGSLPVIMVTARSDTADVIAGLEAGADDYVTKPVVAGELAARIRALWRRTAPVPSTASGPYRVGDLEVDVGRGTVSRGGSDLRLTKTELRLLHELASASGEIVTREQLLERVWGYDYFGDTRLLDVHIRRLRRKIERDPSKPELVVTARGSGYRINI